MPPPPSRERILEGASALEVRQTASLLYSHASSLQIETLPPDERCFSPRVKLSMKFKDTSVNVEDELVGAVEARAIIAEAMQMYNKA